MRVIAGTAEALDVAIVRIDVAIVRIDGVVRMDTVVADDRHGFVDVLRYDEFGDLVVHEDNTAVFDRLYGRVNIAMRPHSNPLTRRERRKLRRKHEHLR